MSRSPDHVTAPEAAQPTPSADSPVAVPEPKAAAWWRHLAFVIALALLPRIGLYFCGLIAMVILFSDQRRNAYTRLGGTLLIGWWTFTWARSGVPPLLGLALLAAAAAAFAVAAVQQSGQRVTLVRNASLAVVAGVLAVLNVVPYGKRSAEFGEDEALRRAVAASAGRVEATHAQVAATRERLIQRPLYVVLLFEPNPTTAETLDREPCFRRAEVHVVDGLDGTVDRADLIDRLLLANRRSNVAEARKKDGFCLPLPRGTSQDIVPLPAAG
jgi:hypothetical protein